MRNIRTCSYIEMFCSLQTLHMEKRCCIFYANRISQQNHRNMTLFIYDYVAMTAFPRFKQGDFGV